jgi:hypothetical protein
MKYFEQYSANVTLQHDLDVCGLKNIGTRVH